MPQDSVSVDVAIVGAGPVGLFAVSQCGTHGLRCAVIDAGEVVGGQCSALYPEKPIYDIPAIPQILAGQFIENLVEQSAPYRPIYRLGERIVKIDRRTDGKFSVQSASRAPVVAGAVILATGSGIFSPNKPALPRLSEFEGKTAHFQVNRVRDFANKKVVIAGGGDSAVDWAIVLAEVATSVTVVHRRALFRASAESHSKMQELAAQGKLIVTPPSQLSALYGEGGILDGVGVTGTLDALVTRIEADHLLMFYGLSMNSAQTGEWGLQHEKGRVLVNPMTHMSSIEGIFAVGDASSYPGKVNLILCGFSEAAQAARAVFSVVNPEKSLHIRHSTDAGLPGLAIPTH